MSGASRLTVIGVGNRDRGDDAVGPIVCDLIAERSLPGVETLVFEGSVLDLPLHWSATDRVVIVDAAEPAGKPGRMIEVDVLARHLTAPTPVSTHTIDVGAAVELARVLDRLPAALSIIGVEGAAFEFGAPLSPAVRQAAERVVTAVTRRRSATAGANTTPAALIAPADRDRLTRTPTQPSTPTQQRARLPPPMS
jgi:hydrogenase maturation protease